MKPMPNGHRATMASRLEAGDSLDYFPSPPWWGRSFTDVRDRLNLPGETCEEPACGEGHLAHGLSDGFARVRATDIHDYGRGFEVRDFLTGRLPADRPDWIVTNPPFAEKTTAFIRRATERARVGAAMLLQLRLMEGVGRYELFRQCGLFAVAVLPRNGSGLRKGLWQPGLSTATTYAWFIFVRPGVVQGWRGFEGEARSVWVEPGSAKALTRPSDQVFAGLLKPAGRRGQPIRKAA